MKLQAHEFVSKNHAQNRPHTDGRSLKPLIGNLPIKHTKTAADFAHRKVGLRTTLPPYGEDVGAVTFFK